MDTHEEVWQVLGAWALDACDDDETRLVAGHLAECPPCREEATRLRRAADVLGMLGEMAPPPGARGRLLSAALAQRPPAAPDLRRLVGGYRVQIGRLGSLLDSLDRDGWAAPVPKHGNVRDLISHLSGNDHALLTALGVAGSGSAPAGAVGWQWQAHQLADRLGTTRLIMRAEPVPLAGPAGLRRPVRDAVVQRMFETWVHADDVRVALDMPRQPPGEQAIGHIVDLGVGLLPLVLTALGRGHPGKTGVLELTGSGAGTWTVQLSSTQRSSTSDGDGEQSTPDRHGALSTSDRHGWPAASDKHGGPAASDRDGALAAEIVAEAVDFCRLMAGRLEPSALRCVTSGEPGPVTDLLHCASRLGCDADAVP